MNMYGNISGSVPPLTYMPNSINDINSVKINTAIAQIRGGYQYPQITGTVYFSSVRGGTLVCAQINGLPSFQPAENGKSPIGPHGFHIHEHGNCDVGSPDDPFAAAHGHWNPTNQPHGNHVGDFPVLFSNHGYAYMCFFTDKFKVADVIGKAVIIHENPDDYRTQPAGNAGKRLACGVINAPLVRWNN
jgi:superoxide dismutase, Cu-Zn family